MSASRLEVRSFPRLEVGDLFRPAHPDSGYLQDYTGLYNLGRNAVYWAFVGLGMPAGTPAWFPAFNCGVEVDAAALAGFDVDFYEVGDDLAVDLADLEIRLRTRPGPVLVIHYFGFPQPEIEAIGRLCADCEVPLVEDCTHALFSRNIERDLGTYGDISVWSLAKTIGMYHGGALKVDEESCAALLGREFQPPPPTHGSPGIYRLFAKDVIRRLIGSGLTDTYRRLRFGTTAEQYSEMYVGEIDQEVVFEREDNDFAAGLADLSLRAARRADPETIVRRRRENYEQLLEMLAGTRGIEPVFVDLPPGVCPLVLPIRTDARDRMQLALMRRGVDCYVFGKWRYRTQSEALVRSSQALREGILGLPVQQGLRREHLQHTARTVAGFAAGDL